MNHSRRWRFSSWKEPGHRPIHRNVEMIALPRTLTTDEEIHAAQAAGSGTIKCLMCGGLNHTRPSAAEAQSWWTALADALDRALTRYDPGRH